MMKARISIQGPHQGTIHLDDQDVSHGVTGFELRQQFGEIPTLHLDLVAMPIDYHGEVATRLHLPAEARELLIAHGWTPPTDQD